MYVLSPSVFLSFFHSVPCLAFRPRLTLPTLLLTYIPLSRASGGCMEPEQSYSFVSSPYARIYEGMQFRVRNARTSASQTMFGVDGVRGVLLWKMPWREGFRTTRGVAILSGPFIRFNLLKKIQFSLLLFTTMLYSKICVPGFSVLVVPNISG